MAWGLLRSIQDADLHELEPLASSASASTSTSRQARTSYDSSHPTIPHARRDAVQAACQHCRLKKIKCDGRRPCGSCSRKHVACHYYTERGETYAQASKRKFDQMNHSNNVYAELFSMLVSKDEQQAADIVARIRAGHSPEAVVKAMKGNEPSSVSLSDPRRMALENWFINLAHSTAPLREILNMAMATLDPASHMEPPDLKDLYMLRDRIVHIAQLEVLLDRPRIPTQVGNNGISMLLNAAGHYDEQSARSGVLRDGHALDTGHGHPLVPPHRVPAAPWTAITTDDEAVSHLVSLYLAWINPTWRFVEQDLFLRGMRSRELHSYLCSPFLVNAICAIACMHTEHDIAFPTKGSDRITRGLHFHDEALRLWTLEEGRPTMTNIQALCVLSVECNYRAKDRLGVTLIPLAAQMNTQVPFPVNGGRGGPSAEITRMRLATHWAVKCAFVVTRIAFMSPVRAPEHRFLVPKIHDVFDDKVDSWIGYPLTSEAIVHRPTLYLQERCRLAGIHEEMYYLLFPGLQTGDQSIHEYAAAVDRVVASLESWNKNLPFELYYTWPVSVDVWELHASYLSTFMILLVAARTKFQEPSSSNDTTDPTTTSVRSHKASAALSKALPLAHQAAHIIRDFRQRYGLKISPAWLLQLQAVAVGVLMQDPTLTNPTSPPSLSQDDSLESINNSHDAFDEVFRSLLGTAVGVMIARGIARMTYHNALQQKVALSRRTRSLLKIMSDTAWRPTDLGLLNSSFPNFAAIGDGHDSVRKGMTDLLREWERLEI